jgi:hypothetical protein
MTADAKTVLVGTPFSAVRIHNKVPIHDGVVSHRDVDLLEHATQACRERLDRNARRTNGDV